MRPAEKLRRMIRRGPIVAPGVFNAITAKLVQRTGFPAAYLSGAGLSNAMTGLPDVGLLTLTELAQQAAYVTGAVKIPLIVDADTGFGGPLHVARCVRALEAAGAAAIQIEDQKDPKRCGHLAGKRLVSDETMAEKIAAAVAAREDPDLLIIARTDARAVEGLEAAIRRARLYREAGAGMIFPEALKSAEEFTRFADRVKGPLMANMTEFGKSPSLTATELARMGYRLVIFPMTIFRVMMKSAHRALLELLRADTSIGFVERMQTRKELYDLLDYDYYETLEAKLSTVRSRKRHR